MACPNCDHTMQNLWLDPKRNVYWCPRCGTLKDYQDPAREHAELSTPMWIDKLLEERLFGVNIIDGFITEQPQ